MTIALYAGSFDPITNGHLDILKSGSEIFEKVIIAVSYNPDKKGFLPVEKRVELIKKSVGELKNVEVKSYNGLTVNFAKQNGASVLLRGLRNNTDYEYEAQLAQINNALEQGIKTVLLVTKPEYSHISSSAVKEIILNKGDITGFVPEPVKEYLNANYLL